MRIDDNGNSWIAISEFHQQSYCEIQLKYKWQGIKIETQKMREGTAVHQQLFEEFEEKTKELKQIGIKNAIQRAIDNNERFTGREVFIISSTFRIFGVIDSVEIGPEGITVSDDKPSKYSYLSDKSQVIAYALAFKDQYKPPLNVYMRVRNRDSGDITWEDVLSQDWVDFIAESINHLQELALGKREFEPTKNPKKCEACSYKEICDKKVATEIKD